MNLKKYLMALALVGVMAPAFAEEANEANASEPATELESPGHKWTPLEIDLFAPLKVWPGDRDIYGIRLNLLYGRAYHVNGIDAGFVGHSLGDMAGVEGNIFNTVEGSLYGVQVGAVGSYIMGDAMGIQVGGLLNWNLTDTYGIQVAPFNFCGGFYGIQIGAFNWDGGEAAGGMIGIINNTRNDIQGGMIGLVNYCKGSISGGQIGAFNCVSGVHHGFQVGLFNAAERLYGAQIGLLNINVMGHMPIMIIANANF